MNYLRYIMVAVSVLLASGVTASGQEVKPAAGGEIKPEIKQNVTGEKQGHSMGTVKRVVAPIGADGIQRVEVIGGEYYFDPNDIVLKVNTPVELKVKKSGRFIPHNLVVRAPEAGIDFRADLGTDWKVITFTPVKIGKYEMICDKKLLWFKSHKDRGMEGIIEVVE